MNDRSLSSESAPQNRDALKIAGLYLLTGGLWILFSDQLALMLTRDPVLLNRISLFKGWGYIVVTALLLYWLIQRYTAGLSQSEARYRSLFQNNHSVMLLIDPKSGHIVDANPSACAFYGYTHSEITRLQITAINQLSREQIFIEMERVRQEQRRQFFFRHRLANGEIRQVEEYSGPIEVQGKQLLYSIVHDITARQQAEAALRESEAKHRTLLEALADGVFVAQDYQFVFANPALPVMLGYTHEAFLGLPFEAVIAPEFLPVWTERFTQRVGSGPEPLKHYEARFLGNGGERSLWVELRASRIEYQGRPAVMGIIHDITERKQTQETLRENEERLRLALMAANQGLYDLNIQTGEAQVSSEYVTMLGYDPATFHETNAAWIERLHPDDRQPTTDAYRAYIAGEVPAYAVEFRQRTQGGDWKWILSMGKIVAWNSAGQPLRMLGTHTDIHERKLAEQQLRYQANLLQNVSDAIIATDANFKITSWNRAAEAIYGWSAAEVMGLSTTDLFQVEYNKFPPEQIDQDFQARGFWQGEVTQKSKSGATIQIMASVSLIRDSQGQPIGAVAVNRDITAYRLAEAQLRQATTELLFLNDLLKHSTQPISVANMQGRFVRFNRAFEQLTGYQKEELLQLTYEQLTPEPWHEIEAQHLANLLATGQAARFEKEYCRKDGAVTPVELVAELYRNAQGEPLYTYGFATDITERKQAEEKLRESESRFSAAFEYAPVGMALISLKGEFLKVNKALCNFFGYTEEILLTKNVSDISHPGDLEKDLENVGGLLARKISAYTMEKRYYHCSGRLMYGLLSVALLTNEQDNPLYFICQVEDITERKQTEYALQTASRRFQMMLSALYGGILVVSNDGLIEFANPAFCRMFDLDDLPESLLGLSALEMIQKIKNAYADPPLALARIREILAAGQPQKGEEIAITGGRTYLRDFIPIIIDGKEYGRLWHHLDITARQQAEAALRQSEENFSKAFKSSPAALLLTRLADGQFIELNDAYCTIVGYNRAELIGRRTTEFNIYLDSSQRQAIVDQLRASGSVRNFETSIRHRSGAVRQVVANQEIITINGEACILSNLLDITARKQAEAELRELQSMLATAESVAGMGSWKWDLQTQKVSWSDEMFNLFDIDRANFDGDVNQILASRIHPDDTEAVNRSNLSVLEAAQPIPLEYRIVLPDGRQRHVWAEGTLTRDSSGRPTALTGYVQDITERKQAEAELHRTMEELTRSNTDLEQFAYVASHDLQEPLRAVAGMLTLLQRRYGGQLDERADEFIRHAVEGATRMQTLINDLLVFSRVGTRGQPFQPVELAGVLADALANLTVAIRESGAVIRHDNLPTVVADRIQLIQLFQNLLSNAIKFRGDQVPDIRIRAERQAGEWVFAVADNGIGLEAPYFERIFGVFQRLHTRREYPGTGIGLALCKKIVERHDGRIWVESEPGQGSTFYFTLPERQNTRN